jgi:hypothetical protein
MASTFRVHLIQPQPSTFSRQQILFNRKANYDYVAGCERPVDASTYIKFDVKANYSAGRFVDVRCHSCARARLSLCFCLFD